MRAKTSRPFRQASRTSADARWAKRRLRTCGLTLGTTAALFVLIASSGYRWRALPVEGAPDADARTAASEASMRGRAPSGVYIVVDRANNRLSLRRGETTLLDAVCSAGSGSVLRDPVGDRHWVFDTPTGRFRVRAKVSDPVWRKPDWAFIEEGRPVPTDPRIRFERGMLGEYALDLGNGYLIHGTLYERLLGRSVTHGCIRVGREDLRVLYRSTPVGTPVYVF